MKKKTLTLLMVGALCVSILLINCFGFTSLADVKKDISVVSNVGTGRSITAATANDSYKVRDAILSLTDSNVNRMSSEHFQIIWGNNDTTGTVTQEFIKGNLINLENIRTFYIEELGMKDIAVPPSSRNKTTYKTNVYVSNTGLSDLSGNLADDWAYMAVDREGYGYLFLAPGAMRVDEPSWVLPHELAHVFTYYQGGTIPYAWYESVANWFRDRYLGSKYYAYGGKTYGPTADFFAPYIKNADYYVPHMLNWYDTWPIFTYISENPDNIDGLGMELMHKMLEYNGENANMYDTLEKLSGVSIKTILGGMSKRLATMDFERQKYYLEHLNNEVLPYDNSYSKIYTTLNAADSQGYQSVGADRAPMQTGFNVIPLSVDLSKDKIVADFVNTSTANGADFRVTLVTSTASNLTRYSETVNSGKIEIALNGDETKAYLVVCATPDVIKNYEVNWNSSASDVDTRYTYKVKITSEMSAVVETPATPVETPATVEVPATQNSTLTSLDAKVYSAANILSDNSHFTVTDNATKTSGQLKINTGSVEFKVDNGANITVTYKCGSSDSSKKAAVVLNGKTSTMLAGGAATQTFTISNLSAGTYKLTATQSGGTSAQIMSIAVTYNEEAKTPANTASTNNNTFFEKSFSNGITSDYFTITGNISTSKTGVSYAGTTYTSYLKMESSTKITFNADASGTLMLVFNKANKKVKINGKNYTTDANGIVITELSSGQHIIKKKDSINLYYISFSGM